MQVFLKNLLLFVPFSSLEKLFFENFVFRTDIVANMAARFTFCSHDVLQCKFTLRGITAAQGAAGSSGA
jgi:hypothetical protein